MGTMSYEDFCILIDQIPPDKTFDLHLQGFGEPLIDKDFVKKISYAREKLPRTRLFFVTNASLLKGDLAKSIILSGVDKIKVSFYGINAGEYEKIHRPLRYNEIRENILAFMHMKKELRSPRPVLSVKYIGRIPHFLRFAFQWLGKARIEFSHFHNYGTGRSFNPLKRKSKALCPMVSRPIMQILWNGDVVPCCYDFNGEYILGNVFTEGIKGVWENKKYHNLRSMNKKHRLTSIPMCAKCDKLK